MDSSPMKSSHPALGVVMIVKNEEKNLGNILGDIKNVVDEIVVLDTGSTDKSREIARSYGVRLGSFAWCDDFSAARNASIDLASADYLLWLDADDRIDEDEAHKLLNLKRNLEPAKNRAYYLKVFNASGDDSDTVSYQLRIFPNLDTVRFEGRLHEQIIPSLLAIPGLSFDRLDITIRHMGYHGSSQIEHKAGRNLSILLKELADGNDSATQHFFIAMTYHALKDYERCLNFIRRARDRSTKEHWYKYSFNLSTEALLMLHRSEEAVSEAKDGVAHFPSSGTMQFNLGAMCLNAQRYEEAIEAFHAARHYGIEMEDFPTPPNIDATLPQYLGMALEKTGRKVEAMDAYRESILCNPDWVPSLRLLGLALVSSGEIDEAIVHLEKAYALAGNTDLQIILSLGRLLRFKGREADAHGIYVEAHSAYPDHPHILSGLVLTSAVADDMDRMLKALESLMRFTDMETNREIQDFPELAGLCAEVGRALLDKNEPDCAAALADTARMLDPDCWEAHLLAADVSLKSDRSLALSCLQNAVKSGAPAEELEKRMALMERR